MYKHQGGQREGSVQIHVVRVTVLLHACFISFSRWCSRVTERKVKHFSQQPALKPWSMHVVVGHGAANKLVHAFVPSQPKIQRTCKNQCSSYIHTCLHTVFVQIIYYLYLILFPRICTYVASCKYNKIRINYYM